MLDSLFLDVTPLGHALCFLSEYKILNGNFEEIRVSHDEIGSIIVGTHGQILELLFRDTLIPCFWYKDKDFSSVSKQSSTFNLCFDLLNYGCRRAW